MMAQVFIKIMEEKWGRKGGSLRRKKRGGVETKEKEVKPLLSHTNSFIRCLSEKV